MGEIVKHFSFLIGAGFSKPAGYPLASEINAKFQNLTHQDFIIRTSQSAALIERGIPQNLLIEKYQYMFVEEFIQFYIQSIISGNSFHYENFYDYYKKLENRNNLIPTEEEFFDHFNKRYNCPFDHNWLLHDFNRTFNQLIAHFITKERPISASTLKPYRWEDHGNFLNLLEHLGESYRVHIHSLNHDLLMEKYFHTQTLGNKISDGFDDSCSPFFGNVTLFEQHGLNRNPYTYDIRLKRFKNKYESIYNLYKLHGSVDNYVFNMNNKKYDMIKTQYMINEGSIVKEITTHTGEIKRERGYTDVIPEFLSGTTGKVTQYERKVYYAPIFKRFQENLRSSNHLVVIGYGFKDSGINEYLNKYFLSDKTKRMLVFDIVKPDSVMLSNDRVNFIQKSALDIEIEEVKAILKI